MLGERQSIAQKGVRAIDARIQAVLQGVAFTGVQVFQVEKAHFVARKSVRRTAKMK